MGGACGSARSVQVAPAPATSVLPQPTAAEPAVASNRPTEKPVAADPLPTAASASTATAQPQPEEQALAAPGALTPPITPPTSTEPRKKKITLIKAVKDNDLTLVEQLLKDGAKLEDLGMWDNTPLLAACMAGHSQVALKLIAHQANIMARNEHGGTPLHYAAVEGMLGVVEALIAAAKDSGDDKQLELLVNCGFVKVYNRHLDAYARRTPLLSAAESGFVEVSEALLDAGANIEEDDDVDKRSPLWVACRHSRVGVVRTLLQRGADTGYKDGNGVSVLEAATATCNEELVLALISQGVGDVNDTAGSPLRDAVKNGKRAVVEALLTHGAVVQPKPGTSGAMPLHCACEKGNEYLVALLVKNRADPSLSDAAGLTAFDILRKRGMPDGQIANLLKPAAPVGVGDGSTGSTGPDD